MADSPLVHLVSVGSDAEAAILRSYLEEHGIYCYIQGENHRSMLGFLGEAGIVNLRIISKTGLPIANRARAFRRGRLR
jgi:hypothetical protein